MFVDSHCHLSFPELKQRLPDILADMRRASNRIMAKLEHEISILGEEHLKALPPRTRADLFLFYKKKLQKQRILKLEILN